MGRRRRKDQCTPEEWADRTARTRANQARYKAKLGEQFLANARESTRVYQASEKGQATVRRRVARPEVRERIRVYQHARYARRSPATERQWAAELYATVAAHVPRTLPPDVRDDVTMEAVLAALERGLSAEQAGALVRSLVSAHFEGRDWHRVLSLDATVPGTDNGATFVDLVASDVEHW